MKAVQQACLRNTDDAPSNIIITFTVYGLLHYVFWFSGYLQENFQRFFISI
jgi:hypothetical protein